MAAYLDLEPSTAGGQAQLRTALTLADQGLQVGGDGDTLADATDSFRARCVDGLAVDERRATELVERSLMLVTALTPHLGYDAAARVARHAHAHGLTVRAAALALGVMTADELDRALAPATMI